MTALGPLSDAPLKRKPRTFAEQMTPKQPWLGLTQGGSSSKFAGARVAAVDGNTQRQTKRK